MPQQIPISDGSLSLVDQGRGPVLLLVHGFPLDGTMWKHQIDDLSAIARVIVPDLRGFGASAASATIPDVLRMEQIADDLAEILAALSISEPVTLCGLSMGGYVAWQFWKRHRPRLARLILCDTRAANDSAEVAQGRRDTAAKVLREGTGSLAEAMPAKLFAASTLTERPETVSATRRVIAAAAPQGVAAASLGMAERVDARPWLASIDAPTLLLCGVEDAITPLKEMREVAGAIPGATLTEIANAGHMSPLEQPIAVNRAIRGFLKA